MARFQIQKIIFDTRTLANPIDNQQLAKNLEEKWQGKVFDCTISELEEEGIESNLDSLVNYMDFTNWLCYEIHLKSLDIQVDSPLEYKESWGGGEYALYPIKRQTYLRVS
jgi:hypothetical protein